MVLCKGRRFEIALLPQNKVFQSPVNNSDRITLCLASAGIGSRYAHGWRELLFCSIDARLGTAPNQVVRTHRFVAQLSPALSPPQPWSAGRWRREELAETMANSTASPSPSVGIDGIDVGILGIALYFPRRAVSQEALEAFDGVPLGKYTVGLGQTNMAVVHPNEDIVSICLTVLQRLVDRYDLSYADIGRLEVGTETVIDKSKSVKSCLMQLFTASGNHDVEGLDCTNACYGGTSALFNTFAWAESSAWDGRYGVVICGDIAVYAPGPARPTGGAGAVALLIARGVNAPIRLEPGMRASCFAHSYDFFKPKLDSEFPTVNGPETVDCFVRAIDDCYRLFRQRAGKKLGKDKQQAVKSPNMTGRDPVPALSSAPVLPLSTTASRLQPLAPPQFTLADVDYCCFHAPFNKMVQRAMARLVYNDFMDLPRETAREAFEPVEKHRGLTRDTSHRNRDAQRDFVTFTRPMYDAKCAPGAWLARQVGNTYTASLYSSLAAMILRLGDDIVGSRVLMFAFGSGFASSMFSLRVVGSVGRIVASLFDVELQLEDRIILPAPKYDAAMLQRERDYCRFGFKPECSHIDDLYPGTFYLASIDEQGRREYQRYLPPSN
jgi:hydroxymethylglutaryl-CoA synthase